MYNQVAHAYGMLGSIRLVTPEHFVIESHPDTPLSDLRLVQPFPELAAFCSKMDLTTMTDEEHMHTPFAVILFQYVEVRCSCLLCCGLT
jgi:amyloid beta precursor protein binding protein 1